MIDFIIYSTTMISIWAVLGLSLNLQFGLTGLVNFGQVMPFAVGAYGAAFAATQGLPAWFGVVIGIVLAPLFGVLVILPARRLTQDYWALNTLVAGQRFRLTMENVPVIAGGIEGARCIARRPDIVMILALALLGGAPDRLARQYVRLLRVLRQVCETLAATLGAIRSASVLVTIVSWTMAGRRASSMPVTGYVSPSLHGDRDLRDLTAVVLGGPGSTQLFGPCWSSSPMSRPASSLNGPICP
jgi:ABC-type branched-subunit amino acid transport system permease subunit